MKKKPTKTVKAFKAKSFKPSHPHMWSVSVAPLDGPRGGIDMFDSISDSQLRYHILMEWPQAVAVAKYILAHAPAKPRKR